MVRLALLLSVIFAVGMALAIFVALELGRRAVEDRVDTTLETVAATAVLADARGTSPSMILQPLDRLEDLPPPFQRASDRGGGSVKLGRDFLGSDTWRVLVTQDSAGSPVMVAVPLEESEEAQELLAGILWTTAALVIASSLAIGLLAGVLSQRRLARIDRTLTRLATGDLAARTGFERARDDLDDIARQLDRTAGELESLVTQTRNLSASLAHDLRTPLARLRSRLEMLPEGAERADALEEAERLSEIFDTIMRVARIEARTDLLERLLHLVDIFDFEANKGALAVQSRGLLDPGEQRGAAGQLFEDLFLEVDVGSLVDTAFDLLVQRVQPGLGSIHLGAQALAPSPQRKQKARSQ